MLLRSPYSDLVIPEVVIHDALLATMSAHAAKVALINGITGQQYTYAQVADKSKKVASALCRLGVRKGDMVSFYCQNAPEYSMMLIGAWANGATVALCNPSYTEYELLPHLEDAQPTWLFTSVEQLSRVRKACEQYRRIKRTISLDPAEGCVSVSDLFQDDGSMYPSDVVVNPKEDVALVPYSSGTTGLPKGVLLTHYNIIANILQMSHEERTDKPREDAPQPIVLNVLPFYHVYGMEGVLLGCLFGGVVLVSLPRFEPHHFLGAIEKYKVTRIPLAPPLVVFLSKTPLLSQYNLSSVELVTSGAAPLKPSTENEFLKKLKIDQRIGNGYGMTEVTCGSVLPGKESAKEGSVGFLLSNMEGKFVNRESGKICGPGELGEFYMRGPNVMKGYLNKPEATREALDNEGFLHSGDIGYYDEDGYIFIVDRIKELIKFKGFQVPPAELEALLLSHPDVDDVGVIGIPDEEAGEVPRAYVTKRPGSKVTSQDLLKFVEERVASFKRLRGGLVFIDKVPKSQSGKILRRQLVELYKTQKSKL